MQEEADAAATIQSFAEGTPVAVDPEATRPIPPFRTPAGTAPAQQPATQDAAPARDDASGGSTAVVPAPAEPVPAVEGEAGPEEPHGLGWLLSMSGLGAVTPPAPAVPDATDLVIDTPDAATDAPVSATPVSATPISATPVSSTPVSSAPVSSIPTSAAPVSSAPVSSAPVSGTPAGGGAAKQDWFSPTTETRLIVPEPAEAVPDSPAPTDDRSDTEDVAEPALPETTRVEDTSARTDEPTLPETTQAGNTPAQTDKPTLPQTAQAESTTTQADEPVVPETIRDEGTSAQVDEPAAEETDGRVTVSNEADDPIQAPVAEPTDTVVDEPLNSGPVHAEPVDSEPARTEQAEAQPIEAEQAEPVKTEPVKTEQIEAEQAEAEQIEADQTEAEQIEPDQAETEPIDAEIEPVEPAENEAAESEPAGTEPAEAKAEVQDTDPPKTAHAEAVTVEAVVGEPAAEPTTAEEVIEAVIVDPTTTTPAQPSTRAVIVDAVVVEDPSEEPASQPTSAPRATQLDTGKASAEPAPADPAPQRVTLSKRLPTLSVPPPPLPDLEPAPRRADPEQVLAAYPWQVDPVTLRETAGDPEPLLAVRDRLTDKLEYAERDTVRASLLSLRAVVSRVLGDLGRALADAREALRHAEATGELQRVALVQARLAHVQQWRGDFAEADRLVEEANSVELPDRLRAELHVQAGRSGYEQGRYLEACNHFEAALELRRVEDPELVARTEAALDAVMDRVREAGWGPYPRSRAEILQQSRSPHPALDYDSGWQGYADHDGEVVIEERYAEAQPFHEGVAWVRRPGTAAWELIDETGALVIDAAGGYLQVSRFADGLAWVSRDPAGGWFAVDWHNRVIVPGGFEEARPFRHGLAVVRRGGWGAVDRHGRVVVPLKYQRFATELTAGGPVDGFTGDGLAVVDAGDRLGVVDRTGQLLVAPVHARLLIHPQAFVVGDRDGRWGALDRDGDPLVEVTRARPGEVVAEIARLLPGTRPVL